jgi:UDP-N-acetylmuramoyl-tripeptide--D-alanyl-D-alanine ligase
MNPRPLPSLAEDCGGACAGPPEVLVRRVCTDSRAVQPGDLFVCLRGPHFDGHAFAAEAWRRGAVAVLGEVGRLSGLPADCPRVTVPDSRVALGRLAAAERRRFAGPVVAVAGSNGKTTTKELLAAVLRRAGRTLASRASFNNDIGVPLTLLELEADHAAAVVEVGTNHPGELAPLLCLAQPTHGVLTRLGREHLEFFGDLDGVIEEEGTLASFLPPEGVLVLVGDSPGAARIRRRTRARVVSVGWSAEDDWQAVAAVISESGTEFAVRAPRPEWSGEYRMRLLGRHQVENALLAVALGAELGLRREQVEAGLADGLPAPHRLQLTEAGGVRVLDDTYNANPESVRAALALLRDLDCPGRRLAVLGDMGEQGRHAPAVHEEIGRAAAAAGVHRLFAVGRWAAACAAGARAGGLTACECFAADAVPAVAAAVLDRAQPGDAVLVKASRAARLERVVEALLAGLAGAGANGAERRLREKGVSCSTV